MWRRLHSSDVREGHPWSRRCRTPWGRLGCSAPVFVLLVITLGCVAGIMLWAIEHMIGNQATDSANSTSNYTDSGHNLMQQFAYLPAANSSANHRIHKRSTEHTDELCVPTQVRSTTLCLALNATTTVTLPWGLLGRSRNSWGSAMEFTDKVWYMTLGGYSEWSWKNLVSESGPDWSDWSKGNLVGGWRKVLTLSTTPTGLKFVIRPKESLGCSQFVLAPYVSNSLDWSLRICFTNISSPQAITVKDNISSPVEAPRKGGAWGPVVMDTTPPTLDDVIQMATGVSGFSNNWLLLTEEAGKSARQSCMVCMGPRPLPRVVPAAITVACVFPVMKNANLASNSSCTQWNKIYPIVKSRHTPLFSSDVAMGNFTCVNMSRGPPYLGNITEGWCNSTHHPNAPLKVVARADVWWWCGGNTLLSRFPPNSTGLCALVSLLLPISVYPMSVGELMAQVQETGGSRSKREVHLTPDNPTYIDAIGVPRGVPDEYKLVNQVTAGFESSICWWCTINKNVDRINYVHFNVQRLGNLTQQGFDAVHGQLSATSLMAFQNRIAVDMLLAEKGGVCSMFGDNCCTFIPNNTASDGSLTHALDGLRTLNGKMKSHSGIDSSSWDNWMDVFGKYKTLISSILVSISVFSAVLVLCGCCCIPCLRSLLNRLITKAIDPHSSAQMYPLLGTEDVCDDDFETEFI
ncbi:envelope protein [Atlantic salmon swim bladder sarcoma virus]|uniref:envelope protein n=1 Tax=Atlantic salmon swim bladder sarcoma virus TaxID=348296 RepID=UPI0000661A2A|nr:envelope protein [Atlantic salmon swim bladder sarcoma virus]ABA54983.1 envelope protein [Atlantic salmon swim bladder sarcoma virus]